MKRINNTLQRVFHRHRLVFWYDSAGEWVETFNAYSDPNQSSTLTRSRSGGESVRW